MTGLRETTARLERRLAPLVAAARRLRSPRRARADVAAATELLERAGREQLPVAQLVEAASRVADLGRVDLAGELFDHAVRISDGAPAALLGRRRLPGFVGDVPPATLARAAAAALDVPVERVPSLTSVRVTTVGSGISRNVEAVVRHHLPQGVTMIRKTIRAEPGREIRVYRSGVLDGGGPVVAVTAAVPRRTGGAGTLAPLPRGRRPLHTAQIASTLPRRGPRPRRAERRPHHRPGADRPPGMAGRSRPSPGLVRPPPLGPSPSLRGRRRPGAVTRGAHARGARDQRAADRGGRRRPPDGVLPRRSAPAQPVHRHRTGRAARLGRRRSGPGGHRPRPPARPPRPSGPSGAGRRVPGRLSRGR